LLEFFNHYSAYIAIPGFVVVMIVLLPIKSWRKRIPIYSAATIIALAVVFALQPGDSTVVSADEAQTVITSGRPVFVEFFSNSCTACLASQPIVKSLEA
jgi:hypothetical protein